MIKCVIIGFMHNVRIIIQCIENVINLIYGVWKILYKRRRVHISVLIFRVQMCHSQSLINSYKREI